MRKVVMWALALSFAFSSVVVADANGKKDGPVSTAGDNAETAGTKSAALPNAPAVGAHAALDLGLELQRLENLVEGQAKQLEAQRAAIEEQKEQIGDLKEQLSTMQPAIQAVPPAANSAIASSSPAALGQPAIASQTSGEENPPLTFKIGTANFTPGGFVDFTTFYRSTNVGSGIGTSFGSIPFNHDAPQGPLSETRFSAQNSRVSLKVDAKVGKQDVTGYIESDFLGNAPNNLFVTSNSNTFRMRLFFVDVRKGKWEFLGGQDWSMMTPNRVGLSPMPADIFYSQNEDTNYQLGLVWARQPQFRAIYHPNNHWALGISLENPEQYTGGLVTFPSGFNPSQVDDSGGNTKTPNLHPDIVAKVAYDTRLSGHAMHVEAAGVFSTFKLATSGSRTTNTSTSGGGGSVNFNFELPRNFHFITNTFWSDGEGRYIFGLGPNFVVTADSAGNFKASLLHAGSGIAGFEYQAVPSTMLYGYYGGAYFQRNFTTVAGSTPTFFGYGFPQSPTSQNRAIQEGTFGIIETLWKNRNYGDLKIITQGSYLVRSPWATTGAPGGAKNARLGMAYVDLRYDLP